MFLTHDSLTIPPRDYTTRAVTNTLSHTVEQTDTTPGTAANTTAGGPGREALLGEDERDRH